MPLVEMTEEEIARRWLWANGWVAVSRSLMDDFCQHPDVVYDATHDRYIKSPQRKDRDNAA